MQRRLVYSAGALDDLVALRTWLTQPGSGPASRRRLKDVLRVINQLRLQPCQAGFGEHPGIRELPCPAGYRTLYRISPDTGRNDTAGDVTVLRVFGPGQDRRVL